MRRQARNHLDLEIEAVQPGPAHRRDRRVGRGAPVIGGDGRPALTVDDGNAYLAAGIAGMGVLWLPRYMALDALARGELVELFGD